MLEKAKVLEILESSRAELERSMRYIWLKGDIAHAINYLKDSELSVLELSATYPLRKFSDGSVGVQAFSQLLKRLDELNAKQPFLSETMSTNVKNILATSIAESGAALSSNFASQTTNTETDKTVVKLPTPRM